MTGAESCRSEMRMTGTERALLRGEDHWAIGRASRTGVC
jgi:hypothetical protein